VLTSRYGARDGRSVPPFTRGLGKVDALRDEESATAWAEQARLSTGASTPLIVVEAEENLRSAELRVARARADLMQTSLKIDHLTGALLLRHPL